MNVFAKLPVYGGNWNVVNSRNFDEEEQKLIKSASVVSSEYGLSVCFVMTSGYKQYIPLSNQSDLGVGDNVDVASAKLLTLHREGSDDILRVDA